MVMSEAVLPEGARLHGGRGQHKLFVKLFVGPAKGAHAKSAWPWGRFETLPLAAILPNTQTAVIRCEPAHGAGPPTATMGKRRWAPSAIRTPSQWATDVLSDPAASMAQCMPLTLCKRCGPVATGFCRPAFPNFRPHAIAPSTDLRFNFTRVAAGGVHHPCQV